MITTQTPTPPSRLWRRAIALAAIGTVGLPLVAVGPAQGASAIEYGPVSSQPSLQLPPQPAHPAPPVRWARANSVLPRSGPGL
jgi:hypothetical protein